MSGRLRVASFLIASLSLAEVSGCGLPAASAYAAAPGYGLPVATDCGLPAASAYAAAPDFEPLPASGLQLPVPARDSLVRIRLFAALKPEVVIFTPVSGLYVVEVLGMEPFVVNAGEQVLLFSVNGRVGVKSLKLPGVMADGVSLKPSAADARFSLSLPGDAGAPRTYGSTLTCLNDEGIFLLLNETTIEEYLPGVVRTEGGTGRPSEFYKAQAVLARTYAWLNLDRHISDGYHLCDDVHCQASYGLTDEKAIIDAVRATSGIVVTGSDLVMVQAAYHSNCGGQTASAADAWLTALPHLQSIADPYCTTSRNSTWRTTIPLTEWQAFLRRSGYSGPSDSPSALTFDQKSRRQYYEPGNGPRIAVTAIRNEFGWRSSFFSFSPSSSSTLAVNGRGYGHGVGLCQEGAMVMASRGNTWREIITFYYRNVLLTDISEAKFPVRIR